MRLAGAEHAANLEPYATLLLTLFQPLFAAAKALQSSPAGSQRQTLNDHLAGPTAKANS